MHWLKALDETLFHWINFSLCNYFIDNLAPVITGGKLLPAILLLGAIYLLWKGQARGRILVLSLSLILPLGSQFVISPLQEISNRPRPWNEAKEVRLISGVPLPDGSGMPSRQTAQWFAASLICYCFYRKSVRFLLPFSILIGLSRIYVGAHYSGDVVAGAVIGAGYAAAGLWAMQALWQWAGKKWFRLWWERMPNLWNPIVTPGSKRPAPNPATIDAHWLNLGYAITLILFVLNLAYNASGTITLSGDEAYQWIWSKHLAMSYYSKPLLIALTQFAGTHLWGDNVFGVRFFSPVIAAITSFIILRFMARVSNPRLAFWMSLILPTAPLLAVGSILMTIDPLNVMFWVLAMIAGWDAIQDNSTTKNWFWVGLWTGLGFLSKYTTLFQILSWLLVFILLPKARKQLHKPGPYAALLVLLLCTLPVVIWNSQHDWITFHHVSQGGGFDKPWAFTAANLLHGFVKYTLEFVAEEIGLQNPFYFIPSMIAAVYFWKTFRGNRPLAQYLFSMGAPIFVIYLLLTFHSRSLPNWIAPSIIPFFCLGLLYWNELYQQGLRSVRIILTSGILLGTVASVLLHDISLVETFTGWHVPDALDSTRRVKGWVETAQVVESARQKLALEGKPVFIIGAHYEITGELTFHLPEAKAAINATPLIYYMTSTVPENQFYFWPGYKDRKGQNALFVRELDFNRQDQPGADRSILDEFESVTETGVVMVTAGGHPMRRIQIFECRGLK